MSKARRKECRRPLRPRPARSQLAQGAAAGERADAARRDLDEIRRAGTIPRTRQAAAPACCLPTASARSFFTGHRAAARPPWLTSSPSIPIAASFPLTRPLREPRKCAKRSVKPGRNWKRPAGAPSLFVDELSTALTTLATQARHSAARRGRGPRLVLIGATTQNPFFAVNSPLLSRSRIFAFETLSRDAIKTLLRRAAGGPGTWTR